MYIPASDSYVVDNDGHNKAFWSFGAAKATADSMRKYNDAEYEVHSRLNYAVTPWRASMPKLA